MTILFAALLALAFVVDGTLLRNRYVSFWAQTPEDYASPDAPPFDIRKELNGPILCEGIIFGPRVA